MSAVSRSQPEGVNEFSEDASLPPLLVLTIEDARRLLDAKAREYLGISGEEFERRWRAGEYLDQIERREIRRIAFYLPGDCEY
jgi:hypothetical protein